MTDPVTIVAQAKGGRHVVGWTLERDERTALLQQFRPRYARTIADHVTLAANVAPGTPLPSPARGEIVGHADDGNGVEALVVAIDGSTDRPGGGTFHITWSLAHGRTARESNDVLRESSWVPLSGRVPLTLAPARIR